MSGVVSGAQFIPRASSVGNGDSAYSSTISGAGIAGSEFTGIKNLNPIASGAFSSQDQATAFQHQGRNVLGIGSKNIGSWLFKNE